MQTDSSFCELNSLIIILWSWKVRHPLQDASRGNCIDGSNFMQTCECFCLSAFMQQPQCKIWPLLADVDKQRVVASATLLIEYKILRHCGKVRLP